MQNVTRGLGALALTLLLSACSKGGQLTLENPSPGTEASNRASFATVNQGGKARLVEQTGQPLASGVTGWVAVQTISSRRMTGGGNEMVLSKPSAFK